MADISSYTDRQHIKQTIKDAYNTDLIEGFPSATPEKLICQMAKDPTCPADELRLNIQCTLLPFWYLTEFYIFCQVYGHKVPLAYFAKYYHVHHEVLNNMMDKMLDRAIGRMSDHMAQTILSVYWQMHEEARRK